MEERFTFADSTTGLEHAFATTLALRRFGFTVRLSTHSVKGYTVHTVIAAPPMRPSRKERLAPYLSQAKSIADKYNRLAEAERRPDLEEC
jgi:hypothetical protein